MSPLAHRGISAASRPTATVMTVAARPPRSSPTRTQRPLPPPLTPPAFHYDGSGPLPFCWRQVRLDGGRRRTSPPKRPAPDPPLDALEYWGELDVAMAPCRTTAFLSRSFFLWERRTCLWVATLGTRWPPRRRRPRRGRRSVNRQSPANRKCGRKERFGRGGEHDRRGARAALLGGPVGSHGVGGGQDPEARGASRAPSRRARSVPTVRFRQIS